jgi:hypothetical protein
MSPTPFTSPLMTETVAIESSSLSKVAYHDHRAILQVEFRDGTIYHYLGVPVHTYRDLLQADSKGAYFNLHIRSLFAHTQKTKAGRFD